MSKVTKDLVDRALSNLKEDELTRISEYAQTGRQFAQMPTNELRATYIRMFNELEGGDEAATTTLADMLAELTLREEVISNDEVAVGRAALIKEFKAAARAPDNTIGTALLKAALREPQRGKPS